MCGIAGVLDFDTNFELTREEIEGFVNPLRHRGPDGEQHHLTREENIYLWLAHRRLSIIDLTETGSQPMASYTGQSIIVFNGEIYNYRELRSELILHGRLFRSNSDTEVILNAFECWGIERALQKLDGMFAFAIYDKKERRLYLARDRFGKKPLYYYARGKQVIFSSDVRSFKAIRRIPLTIDPHALGYFFAELATPHENTIWCEVKKVAPASYMQFGEPGLVESKSFWRLKYSEDCTLGRKEIIEKTEFLLGQAVKKRLVADVEVSALLSGGIDSTLVVAKMAEHSSEPVKTYSVGFKEDRFNELPFARQVAEKFNTNHTELIIESRSLDNINDLILEFGEPFADSSMIPTYLMSKEISKNEKVVLGGDGGDELFGGYPSYHFTHKYDSLKQFSRLYPLAVALNKLYPSYRTDFLKQVLKQSSLPSFTLLNRHLGFEEDELKCLFNNEQFFKSLENEHTYIWNNHSSSSSALINVLSASLKTRLLNDYLVKVDRASMYASLEMRSPFLDRDLAEFTATLKPSQLFYRMGTKSILKEIAEKHFPKHFVHRNKMGFGVPLGSWFKGDLVYNLKDTILDRKQGLIDINYDFVEKILEEHTNGIVDHTHKLWSVYVFHIWANNQ
jgi:asparagine synthase (glutamine-hydrolysing)